LTGIQDFKTDFAIQRKWYSCSWLLLGAALLAHSALLAQTQSDSPAALQEAAEKKNADWDALAKTVEARIARMLPCDARVRGAIEEVSRASEARLSALSQYLQAVAAQFHADAQLVAQALSRQEEGAREGETNRAETEQERIAVDAQLTDLAESLKRRAQLAEAQRSLSAIADVVRQRVENAQQQAAKRAALTAGLRELAAALETRDTAVQAEIAAAGAEASRWSEYYAARLARAQTECAILNAGPSRPLQRKKK
jgi:hypothetical protein